MTLTIELTPEEKARLQQAAARQGTTSSKYVRNLLRKHLTETDAYETATPEERAQAFLQWAANHDKTIPPPPPESLERESLYEGRL